MFSIIFWKIIIIMFNKTLFLSNIMIPNTELCHVNFHVVLLLIIFYCTISILESIQLMLLKDSKFDLI